MGAALILLWAGCLYMLARSVLCLLLTASPWRRLAVLAVLALTLACCRSPEETRGNHQ